MPPVSPVSPPSPTSSVPGTSRPHPLRSLARPQETNAPTVHTADCHTDDTPAPPPEAIPHTANTTQCASPASLSLDTARSPAAQHSSLPASTHIPPSSPSRPTPNTPPPSVPVTKTAPQTPASTESPHFLHPPPLTESPTPTPLSIPPHPAALAAATPTQIPPPIATPHPTPPAGSQPPQATLPTRTSPTPYAMDIDAGKPSFAVNPITPSPMAQTEGNTAPGQVCAPAPWQPAF